MTRDDGSDDGAPRSVAELLAAYGGQYDSAAPRHRRRRAGPDPEPGLEPDPEAQPEQVREPDARPGRSTAPEPPLLSGYGRPSGMWYEYRGADQLAVLTPDPLELCLPEPEPQPEATARDGEPAVEQPAVEQPPDEQPPDDRPVRSPGREWLALVGQLTVGAVGGAALWVGFQWLWHNLPMAALVIAVLVTIGLVFGMRALRRTDDLQTTALAVVVGLVVTVSPAALVLTGR